jgi:TPR repeat protein
MLTTSLAVFANDDYERLNQAQELLLNKKPKEAFSMIEPIAQKGNIQAQIMLGNYYLIEEKNIEKGRLWLHKAAESGDSYAQLHLAGSYLGRGSIEEDKEGIKWLMKSAKQNNPAAADQLSMGYSKGWWGLLKDEEKAKYWKSIASGIK